MYLIVFSDKLQEFKFIAKKETVASGTLMEVTQMALNFGIPEVELISAFKDLKKTGNKIANFGINKYFMYSN